VLVVAAGGAEPLPEKPSLVKIYLPK